MTTGSKRQCALPEKWRIALIAAVLYQAVLLAIDLPGSQEGIRAGGAFPDFAESLGNFPVSILAFGFADYLAGVLGIKYTMAHAAIGHICSAVAGVIWWAAFWSLVLYAFRRFKAMVD